MGNPEYKDYPTIYIAEHPDQTSIHNKRGGKNYGYKLFPSLTSAKAYAESDAKRHELNTEFYWEEVDGEWIYYFVGVNDLHMATTIIITKDLSEWKG